MEKWADEVISKWKDEGLKINKGAPAGLISAAESFLNFQFPNDFKQLYLKMNGFAYLEFQEHWFSLWSIERIIEEFDSNRDFIGFSDFSLSVNHIGFRNGRTGIYKVYPSTTNLQPALITTTFTEVVGMINANSELVY